MLKRVFNLNAGPRLEERRIHERGGVREEVPRRRSALEKEEAQLRQRLSAFEEEDSQEPENQNNYVYKGIVIATRHGDTPSNEHGITLEGKAGDTVTGESIAKLHRQGKEDLGALVRNSGIGEITRAKIKHSNKDRTWITAKALLSGVTSGTRYATGREAPSSREQLETQHNFDRVDIERDDRLSYQTGKPGIHEKLFKSEKTGVNEVLNNWLENPLTDKHVHEKHGTAKIEPFINVYHRTKGALQEALQDVREGKHNAFFLASHGSLKEPMIISVMYAAGAQNIRKIEQIGGPIQKGEYFVVLVRQNRKTGRDEGLVRFRGNEFAFDLENFMDNAKDPYLFEVRERMKRGEFDNPRTNEELQRQRGYSTPKDGSYDENGRPIEEDRNYATNQDKNNRVGYHKEQSRLKNRISPEEERRYAGRN